MRPLKKSTASLTVVANVLNWLKDRIRLRAVYPSMRLFRISKPTGHVMNQQINIQQLYVLPTLYLCVLYLSENKQRLVPLTAQTDWFL